MIVLLVLAIWILSLAAKASGLVVARLRTRPLDAAPVAPKAEPASIA